MIDRIIVITEPSVVLSVDQERAGLIATPLGKVGWRAVVANRLAGRCITVDHVRYQRDGAARVDRDWRWRKRLWVNWQALFCLCAGVDDDAHGQRLICRLFAEHPDDVSAALADADRLARAYEIVARRSAVAN